MKLALALEMATTFAVTSVRVEATARTRKGLYFGAIQKILIGKTFLCIAICCHVNLEALPGWFRRHPNSPRIPTLVEGNPLINGNIVCVLVVFSHVLSNLV